MFIFAWPLEKFSGLAPQQQ